MSEEIKPIDLYPPKTYPSNKPENVDCCFLDRDLFKTATPTPTVTPVPTRTPAPTPSSTLTPTPTPSSAGRPALSATPTPTPTNRSIADRPISCLGELPDGSRNPAPPGKEETLYIIDKPSLQRVGFSYAPILAFVALNDPLTERVQFTRNKYVFVVGNPPIPNSNTFDSNYAKRFFINGQGISIDTSAATQISSQYFIGLIKISVGTNATGTIECYTINNNSPRFTLYYTDTGCYSWLDPTPTPTHTSTPTVTPTPTITPAISLTPSPTPTATFVGEQGVDRCSDVGCLDTLQISLKVVDNKPGLPLENISDKKIVDIDAIGNVYDSTGQLAHDETVVATSNSGRIYISFNDGIDWQNITPQIGTLGNWTGVHINKLGTIVAISVDAGIATSIDFGNTWQFKSTRNTNGILFGKDSRNRQDAILSDIYLSETNMSPGRGWSNGVSVAFDNILIADPHFSGSHIAGRLYQSRGVTGNHLGNSWELIFDIGEHIDSVTGEKIKEEWPRYVPKYSAVCVTPAKMPFEQDSFIFTAVITYVITVAQSTTSLADTRTYVFTGGGSLLPGSWQENYGTNFNFEERARWRHNRSTGLNIRPDHVVATNSGSVYNNMIIFNRNTMPNPDPDISTPLDRHEHVIRVDSSRPNDPNRIKTIRLEECSPSREDGFVWRADFGPSGFRRSVFCDTDDLSIIRCLNSSIESRKVWSMYPISSGDGYDRPDRVLIKEKTDPIEAAGFHRDFNHIINPNQGTSAEVLTVIDQDGNLYQIKCADDINRGCLYEQNKMTSFTRKVQLMQWHGLASSDDGNLMFASSYGIAGFGDSFDRLYKSTDKGQTWSIHPSFTIPSDKRIYGIHMSPDGSKVILLCHSRTTSNPDSAQLYFSENYGNTFIEKIYPGRDSLIFDGKLLSTDGSFFIALEAYGDVRISTRNGDSWQTIPSRSFETDDGRLIGRQTWRGLGTANNHNIILLGPSDLAGDDKHIYRILNKRYENENDIRKIRINLDSVEGFQPSGILVSDDGQRIVIANYAKRALVSWDGGVTWKDLPWSINMDNGGNETMTALVGNSDLSVIRGCSYGMGGILPGYGRIYTMFPQWNRENEMQDMTVDSQAYFGSPARWYSIVNPNIGQLENEILVGVTYDENSTRSYGLHSTKCESLCTKAWDFQRTLLWRIVGLESGAVLASDGTSNSSRPLRGIFLYGTNGSVSDDQKYAAYWHATNEFGGNMEDRNINFRIGEKVRLSFAGENGRGEDIHWPYADSGQPRPSYVSQALRELTVREYVRNEGATPAEDRIEVRFELPPDGCGPDYS